MLEILKACVKVRKCPGFELGVLYIVAVSISAGLPWVWYNVCSGGCSIIELIRASNPTILVLPKPHPLPV